MVEYWEVFNIIYTQNTCLAHDCVAPKGAKTIKNDL